MSSLVIDFDIDRLLAELRANRDEIVKMVEYLATMNKICIEENLQRPGADLVIALMRNLQETNDTIRRAEALSVVEETFNE